MSFIEESDTFFVSILSGTESPKLYKRQLISDSSNFGKQVKSKGVSWYYMIHSTWHYLIIIEFFVFIFFCKLRGAVDLESVNQCNCL